MRTTDDRLEHPDDEALAAVALARDDPAPGPDAPAGTAEHVRSCPRCRSEVEELRAVAAVLRSTAGDDARGPLEPLASPGPELWADIEAQTRGAVPLRRARPAPRPKRSVSWLLAAAAVAGVLVGVVGDRVLAGSGPPPGATATSAPSPDVVGRTTLTELDGTTALGDAELLRLGDLTELRVHLTAQMPTASGGGYREVWLINVDGRRMVSVGVLAGTTETFVVPGGALEQGYRVVDVSREPADGNPVHSGDSIMRGTLPA